MFLTRAAQIIGKEGFKTFGYALQQKMHQNMTDAKVYGIYQKKSHQNSVLLIIRLTAQQYADIVEAMKACWQQCLEWMLNI